MTEEITHEYKTCEKCRETYAVFMFPGDAGEFCYLCVPLDELAN